MKKSSLVLIIILTAAIASAATIGVQKLLPKLGGGASITIISDKRCVECQTQGIETSIQRMFPEEKIVVLDYGESKGKSIYDKESLSVLPAVLIPKRLEKSDGYSKVSKFAEAGKKFFVLKTGGQFDPKAEICDNKKDDNEDKLVDCDDPTCKTDWKCMEKREKPDVDVFVMSHCPFGTQIQKGVLPVWDLIGDKINLNMRFVDYAMHGKKEVDEQLKQYCVQKGDQKKYRKYLECFLKDGAEDNKCLKTAGVDEAELSVCIKESDEKFGISKDYENKEKWKGRFPPFGVDKVIGEKYKVQGSPTLVINDVVAKAGRSPKAILDAVCQGFKTKPAECEKQIDDATPSPGFGFNKSGTKTDAGCGS